MNLMERLYLAAHDESNSTSEARDLARDAIAEIERLQALAPLDVHEQEDSVTTTVVARIRALGIGSDRRLAWRVGAMVRDSWQKCYGQLPTKANTTKVSGTGSHCHARYPHAWAPRIDDMILHTCGDDGGTQGVFPW